MTLVSGPRPKPVILAVLDGWGHREELKDNAIANAQTPVWDRITRDYPNGFINASEAHVGLPGGQMGNSEVGHMNIGSGRIVMQDLPRIDAAIADGSLAKNSVFLDFAKKAKRGTGVIHLLGLLSPGGVHAHQQHLAAIATLLAQQGRTVWIHAFLDGRDTPPQSALDYLKEFERAIASTIDQEIVFSLRPGGINSGISTVSRPIKIATVTGRYYVMDRDNRWDRIQKAYETLTNAEGRRFATAQDAINTAYASGTTDEFIPPSVIGDYQCMQHGDGIMMVNFRSDRAREILTALLDPDFEGFPREEPVQFSAALGITEYSKPLNRFMQTLFPPAPLTHIFGEVISHAGFTQLRIAETEKYAHVTFFFNGGREQEFPGEERILIPSPKVATYDEKPEMSAPEITDKLVEAIHGGRYDVIVVNYANTDMVGHTGNIQAAIKAVETVDSCLGRVIEAALAEGGAVLITADHGNAEMMFDHDTHQPHTAHTLNLVPVVIVAAPLKDKAIALAEGKLADIAPTLLQLLQLPQPGEMTGHSLLAAYG